MPELRIETGEHTLTIAVGFFDESTDEQTKGMCYVVAGLVGTNATTGVLELRWRKLLRRYNLLYFKASELNAGEGQFRQYRDDPEDRSRRLFSNAEKDKLQESKQLSPT